MSMLKDIHDYIKKDYEAGNYDDAKAAYTSWKTENNQLFNDKAFEISEFIRGYNLEKEKIKKH